MSTLTTRSTRSLTSRSFVKPIARLALVGTALIASLASAAESQSDPQSLARELLSPTRVATPSPAPSLRSVPLPDAQVQAQRLLAGNSSGVRGERSARGDRALHPREPRSRSGLLDARDLARRMILGHQA